MNASDERVGRRGTLTITAPLADLNRFKAAAAAEDRSVSNWVLRALRRELEAQNSPPGQRIVDQEEVAA
jgi:hypothetical protein